ncbi:immune inhibitor A [Nocardioides panacihumi]|uniref:Immune inhibitor A n=1 Tax=Nocardioides panacihumi TaxID=400774 RepID=A0ABP5D8P3_9ACTN
MNRRISGVIGAAASLGLAAVAVPTALAPVSASAVPAEVGQAPNAHQKNDDRPDPKAAHWRALKQKAVEQVARGERKPQTKGGGQAVKVGPGQWVEYGTQQTAQLLTFLVDFGNKADPRFPTAPAAGPVHNQIPAPAADDNSTYWEPDFSQEHYKEMFFTGLKDQNGESFHDVYNQMSSGRFDLKGDVSNWVTVPYNEASYGQTESNQDMTRFVQDSADAWYADQLAQGKTKDQIVAYLKSFDQWDRYDLDGDGNFNEPDGYIDHFQAIHAGTGEEAGAPKSAIWSHRWAVNPSGSQGPGDYGHAGGIRIGDTDLWIRDYTTEPENGGLGVFSHEFGHDLGLPDYYDTAGGDNGTGFWNLMSSGSWMNHGTNTIGTTPNHMGATEKLFLGWLDYATVAPGQKAKVDLGPSYHATRKSQAVFVDLPDGKAFTPTGPASSGDKYLYSGTGDDRTATAASPSFTVPAGGSLTAKVNYSIETDWDYAYAEISTDGGKTYTPLATNLSTDANPNNQNDGHGITGSSNDKWVDLSADLSAYAGQTASVRFRMFNDGGYHEIGLKVDDVAVGSALSTDFEGGFDGWTFDGFHGISGGGYDTAYQQYYLAENRVYGGYDQTLAQGPYNFGWLVSHPQQVEHFPYQDGLLVWYKNGLYTDNNTKQHPGYGQALPVDAHPKALTWSNGSVARARIQSYDMTFGLQKTDPLSLHLESVVNGQTVASTLVQPSQPAVSVFDDTDPNRYYDASNPQGSTKVAGTGTKIKVLSQDTGSGTMTVQVN